MKPLTHLFRRSSKAAGSSDRTGGSRPHGQAAARTAVRDRLRAERDRYLGFAFASGSVLMEVRTDARIVFAAGALLTFLKEPAERLIGQSLLEFVAPADRGALSLALIRLSTKERLLPLTVRLEPERTSGESVVITGCRLPGVGRVVHLSMRPTAPGEEVPERDPDSGLLGRDALARMVSARVAAGTAGDQPLLTLLELDGLDALHGRLDSEQAGRLPHRIGSLLHEAASDGKAARFAPERFGLMHEPGRVIADLERQLASVLREADPSGEGIVPRSVTLTLDVEGLSAPDAAKTIGFVIRRFADGRAADETPLHSLRDGFNTMLAETVARLVDYRGALADDRLELAFQPIVRLTDEQIDHYEVLVRPADDPSPARLLDFAEAIDLVDELDLAVCRRAIALLESAAPTLALAVNLSGRSFENRIFVAALLEMLDRAEAVRDRLSFELTETAEAHDLTAVNEVIQAIRSRGCEVGLDDFGTGAATFHYMRAFDVDFVKIDGSLIKSTKQRDKAIVRSVVDLCRELEIATVAEMVETRNQAEWLAKLKVTFAQGYLFGRPSSHPGHGADLASAPAA